MTVHNYEFGRMRNIANIGDLITISGYDSRIFEISSYTHEIYVDEHTQDEAIIYDSLCIDTGKYTMGYQEDISVVVDASNSEAYKAQRYSMGIDFAPPIIIETVPPLVEEKESPSNEVKETKINRLLDEINDYSDLIKNFGDENGKYALAINEAQAKLIEIIGEKEANK